jgi:hypothetical protein
VSTAQEQSKGAGWGRRAAFLAGCLALAGGGVWLARDLIGERIVTALQEHLHASGVHLAWDDADWVPGPGVRLINVRLYRDAAMTDEAVSLSRVRLVRASGPRMKWDALRVQSEKARLQLRGAGRSLDLTGLGVDLDASARGLTVRTLQGQWGGWSLAVTGQWAFIPAPAHGQGSRGADAAAPHVSKDEPAAKRGDPLDFSWLRGLEDWGVMRTRGASVSLRLKVEPLADGTGHRADAVLDGRAVTWRDEYVDAVAARAGVAITNGPWRVEVDSVKLRRGPHEVEASGSYDSGAACVEVASLRGMVDGGELAERLLAWARRPELIVQAEGGLTVEGAGVVHWTNAAATAGALRVGLAGALEMGGAEGRWRLGLPELLLTATNGRATAAARCASVAHGGVEFAPVSAEMSASLTDADDSVELHAFDAVRGPGRFRASGRVRLASFPRGFDLSAVDSSVDPFELVRALSPGRLPDLLRWEGVRATGTISLAVATNGAAPTWGVSLGLGGAGYIPVGTGTVQASVSSWTSQGVGDHFSARIDGIRLGAGAVSVEEVALSFARETNGDVTFAVTQPRGEVRATGRFDGRRRTYHVDDAECSGNLPEWVRVFVSGTNDLARITGGSPWRARVSGRFPTVAGARPDWMLRAQASGEVAYRMDTNRVTASAPAVTFCASNGAVRVEASAARAGWNGLAWDRVRGSADWRDDATNGPVAFRVDDAQRDGGSLQGEGTWDPATRRVRIGRFGGTLNPLGLARDVNPALLPEWASKGAWTFDGTAEIPVDRPERIEVRANAAVKGELSYRTRGVRLRLDSPKAQIEWRRERVTVRGLEAGLWSGRLRVGEAWFSGGTNPVFRAVGELQGARTESISADVDAVTLRTGRVDVTWDGGGGFDVAMLRSTGAVVISEMQFYQLPLLGPLHLAIDRVQPGFGKDVSSHLTTRFALRDGVLRLDGLSVDSQTTRVTASGTVDCKTGQVAMTAQGRLQGFVLQLATGALSELLAFEAKGKLPDVGWQLKYVPGSRLVFDVVRFGGSAVGTVVKGASGVVSGVLGLPGWLFGRSTNSAESPPNGGQPSPPKRR